MYREGTCADSNPDLLSSTIMPFIRMRTMKWVFAAGRRTNITAPSIAPKIHVRTEKILYITRFQVLVWILREFFWFNFEFMRYRYRALLLRSCGKARSGSAKQEYRVTFNCIIKLGLRPRNNTKAPSPVRNEQWK